MFCKKINIKLRNVIKNITQLKLKFLSSIFITINKNFSFYLTKKIDFYIDHNNCIVIRQNAVGAYKNMASTKG